MSNSLRFCRILKLEIVVTRILFVAECNSLSLARKIENDHKNVHHYLSSCLALSLPRSTVNRSLENVRLILPPEDTVESKRRISNLPSEI